MQFQHDLRKREKGGKSSHLNPVPRLPLFLIYPFPLFPGFTSLFNDRDLARGGVETAICHRHVALIQQFKSHCMLAR